MSLIAIKFLLSGRKPYEFPIIFAFWVKTHHWWNERVSDLRLSSGTRSYRTPGKCMHYCQGVDKQVGIRMIRKNLAIDGLAATTFKILWMLLSNEWCAVEQFVGLISVQLLTQKTQTRLRSGVQPVYVWCSLLLWLKWWQPCEQLHSICANTHIYIYIYIYTYMVASVLFCMAPCGCKIDRWSISFLYHKNICTWYSFW